MRRSRATAVAVAAAFLAVLATLVSAPSASAAVPGGPINVCPRFSGLDGTNPYVGGRGNIDLAHGYVTIMGHSTKLLNTSTGAVNWSANPYKNTSWQIWLHSLKWVGDLVFTATRSSDHPTLSYAQRDAALLLAQKIALNYIASNRTALSSPSLPQRNSSGHRAQVFGCLLEVLGSRASSTLRSYAKSDATWLLQSKNYAGAWNQGLEQDLGALTMACMIPDSSLKAAAVARATATMNTNIDPEGATNEQSIGYGAYGYALWNKVITSMNACGIAAPGVVSRVKMVPDFLAWASTPNGRLEQLGDTTYDPSPNIASTAAQYTATLGALGTPPTDRTKIYANAGYVFGRSGWANLTTSMYYSLRFGPAMAMHGHADKTSVTYWVRGKQILTDSGHIGYTDLAARIYLRSTAAHNSVSTPARTYLRQGHGAATLYDSWYGTNADGYTVSDYSLGLQVGTKWTPYAKKRSIVVLRNPDMMVVLDTIAGGAKGQVWTQRWHMAPGAKRVSGSSLRATFNTGTSILSVPVATTPAAKTSVVSSWIARTTGVKTPDVQAVVTASGRHAQFLTIVAPNPGVTYRYDATLHQITIYSNGNVVTTLQIFSDGRLAPPVS
jgi:hypothetical protein